MQIKLDDGAIMPTKAHETDAGWDLYTPGPKYILQCGSTIDTGVHVAIPDGCVGLVVGRSGLNFNRSVIVPQGTIDPGYTGSIRVRLYALNHAQSVEAGDRIAQLLVLRTEPEELELVDSLPESERGADGFGSSGR